MPRYFFYTDDGDHLVKDEEGLELDGLEAVRIQAQSALADMARDVVPGDGNRRTMTVYVRDEAGTLVLHATLTLTIAVGAQRG